MKAAVLREYGSPRLGEFAEPEARPGQRVVEVAAAGVNHVDLAKCAGTFYAGPPRLPSVAGTDGVGRLDDGRRVYFDTTVSPFGALAERTLADETELFGVPDGVDDALAAALGNAGLAGWLALTWRAKLRAGERVLVLGATGAVGTIAMQAARLLGASHVVAAGRDPERLARLPALGASASVALDGDVDDLPGRLREATHGGADVVVDLLWGRPALAAMRAAAPGARHVQVGHTADLDVALPASAVRAAPVTLMGYANFHVPLRVRRKAYARLTALAARGEITLALERIPLRDIERTWERQRTGAGCKLVIVP